MVSALVAALALLGTVRPTVAQLDFLSDLNLVSPKEESELSRGVAAEVEKKHRLVRDERIAGYVTAVGRRLVRTLREPVFRYDFRVVADPSFNAFNVGGGRIYVHTGLLTGARTEGEVASVLAHEIGHQVERHVAKAISREHAFRTAAAFLFGRDAASWVNLAVGLGITTGQIHFSRDAERKADDVMVTVLSRAGYDPREAVRMLERIQQIQRGDPGRVASFFSSHPPTSERIERVRERVARLAPGPGLRRDSKRFHAVQRLVRAR